MAVAVVAAMVFCLADAGAVAAEAGSSSPEVAALAGSASTNDDFAAKGEREGDKSIAGADIEHGADAKERDRKGAEDQGEEQDEELAKSSGSGIHSSEDLAASLADAGEKPSAAAAAAAAVVAAAEAEAEEDADGRAEPTGESQPAELMQEGKAVAQSEDGGSASRSHRTHRHALARSAEAGRRFRDRGRARRRDRRSRRRGRADAVAAARRAPGAGREDHRAHADDAGSFGLLAEDRRPDRRAVQAEVSSHGVVEEAGHREERQEASAEAMVQQKALGLIRREKTAESTALQLRDAQSPEILLNPKPHKKARSPQLRANDPDQGIPTFTNGWAPWGDIWAPVTYTVRNLLCFVTGLAKAGIWTNAAIAELPDKCRPAKRLVFSLNNHAQPSRVEVSKLGMIEWKGGGRSHGWVSLSGIVFAADSKYSTKLDLKKGAWVPHQGSHIKTEFGTPSFTLSDGFCCVEGAIQALTTQWAIMATLPEECRPKKNLVFNVYRDNGAGINDIATSFARVDVAKSGNIQFKTGASGKQKHWLSLSGIIFPTQAAEASLVALSSGWTPYTHDGGGLVTFTVQNGVCVLDGSADAHNTWGVGGLLPKPCRPDKRLIFQVSNNDKTSRVDVLTDGTIAWQGGGKDNKWISLAGIAFDINRYDASLKGERGERGEDGKNGRPGPSGPTGVSGARGLTGPSGQMGIMGDKGEKGPPGDPGKDGSKGDVGETGMTGEKGETGAPGLNGERGPMGTSGLNGMPGKNGHDGRMPPKIDCTWMEWMEWEPCSHTCGGGAATRFRSVDKYPQNGGKNCDGAMIEQKTCGEAACPKTPTTPQADEAEGEHASLLEEPGGNATNATNASAHSSAPRRGAGAGGAALGWAALLGAAAAAREAQRSGR